MWPPYETIKVRLRTFMGSDRLGNTTYEMGAPIDVPQCLWAPGTPAELAESRPEGVKVAYTVHMPRGWSGQLRGALVSLDGGTEWLRVVGDPREFPTLPNGHLCCAVMLEGIDG